VAKSKLLVCPSCERHVRVTDAACPFCGLALPIELRASLALRSPTKRLGRAALYALGMGTLSLAAACGGTVETLGDGGSGDGGTSAEAGDGGTEACFCPPYGLPAYGGSPIDAQQDGITIGPAYGAPVDAAFPDAGDDDASDAEETEGSIFPHYGAPPGDGG
jgi:hypothetical protein